MPKIAFIGAGSVVFTRNLLADILLFPELRESTISLMDIDPARLDVIHAVAKCMVRENGLPTQIEATLDRKAALDGANYVIVMIQVGREQGFIPDINIPLKYGLKQSIGDTMGPGGVFRTLRTVPAMLEICRDMEKSCPNALLINYSNPMAMLCWAINAATSIKNIGLCHSIQGTTAQLAEYVGVPIEEITCLVAGINHMAWFLEFTRQDEDLYPLLREKLNDPSVYNRDRIRFEVMRHFGHFVSESSGHFSEYVPYFRRNDALIDRYCTDALGGETAFYLRYASALNDMFEDLAKKTASGDGDWALVPSGEYAAATIHSMETGQRCTIHGNVANKGYITNLPEACCVEVPCHVDDKGIHPDFIGDLPQQLAALNLTNINVQDLAVRAALEQNRELAFHAIALDPLTSAVLSLDEIRRMVEDLIEAEKEFIPKLVKGRGAIFTKITPELKTVS
jgi:alpha-galactosidase